MRSPYFFFKLRTCKTSDNCGSHQIGKPALFRIDCFLNKEFGAFPIWKVKDMPYHQEYWYWLLKCSKSPLYLITRKNLYLTNYFDYGIWRTI